jgi:hypothetical protein
VKRSIRIQWFAGFILASSLSGCHSIHIEATVVNRSGSAVQLVEVDYPSASFGIGRLAAGDEFHYRFQVEGSGPVKVQYTTGDGRTAQVTGPTVDRNQEGRLEIVLLPGGKAEFLPQLTTHR